MRLIAAEILAHLQIAVPRVPDRAALAGVPRGEPRRPSADWARGRLPVEPGWHFGSRHPGNPDTLAIYDFIPDALLAQVANSEQFRAVLVFDRWVANADGRQSRFFPRAIERLAGAAGRAAAQARLRRR